MPLTYQMDTPPEPVGITADRRLYLAADRQTVVEEGAPECAFLLASQGSVIPTAEAASLKLSVVGGKVVQGASAVLGAGSDDAAPVGGPEPSDVPVEKPAKRGRGK